MERMALKLLSMLLLLSAAEIRLSFSQTQTALQNITLWKSANATIQCTAYSNPIVWTSYTPGRIIIYNVNNNNYNLNPSKYIVGNGSSTLTITNVDLPDGGSYCCADNTYVEVCSNVLVIGSLVPSVNPSNGLNSGTVANLSCLLTYYSPVKDPSSTHPLSNDQDPQLAIGIGGMDMSSQATVGEQVIGNAPIYNSKFLSLNWTATNPNNQPLTCTVSSANPSYSNSTYTSLNYFSAAGVINMTFPNNSTTSAGGPYSLYNNITINLTCYASGYPPPTITIYNWTAATAVVNQLKTISNAYSLSYTVQQAGFYNVFCSVYNSLNQNGTYNSTPVSFAVDGPGYSGNGTALQPSTSKDNKVGLGVGLGIGLGVPILIGLILLIVFLNRRKKRNSQPYTVKQAEKTSRPPPTTGSGKPPNSNGKNPDLGPRNNVNTNPNPTYQTPVMPEQTGTAAPRTVRDSPGYGDLGVRHIGGSGSNPHLNQSFDSNADRSFESLGNRPPVGGNIQFQAGRANNSSPANNTSV